MGLKLGPCTCSILIRSGLARWWTGRRKVVPHAVENKKNRAQSKTLSKVDGIIANPSGNSWPEFDSPKKSKYVGNRMMERGYFATVFPDEGCLANPRWRMSCKWCQIVKLMCCATFPWPSQNSKTKDVLRRRGPPGSLTLVAEPCADVAKKMFCVMWFVQVRHVVDLPLTGFFFRSTSGQEFPVGFANNSIYSAFWTGPCFSTFFSQLV